MILWDGARRVLKGNLHVHTTLSDGKRTPDEVRALYRSHGYDFLAITDHRRVTTETAMVDGLLSIRGIEFDFNLTGQVIHIVGIGVPEEVAQTVTYSSAPQRAIDEINRLGGVPVLAHPAWSLNTPDVICALRDISISEIYNTVSGLPWNADRADSSGILDICSAMGHAKNLVASDDAHFYNGDACQSWTMVASEENTEEAIKAALRRGDFYATRGPEFKRIEFDGHTVSVDCSAVRTVWFPSELPWGSGRVFTGENLTHVEYPISELNRRFVRVVLEDENGKRAWSNPIVLDK